MRNSYIIEIGEDAVGVVVRDNDRYHFVAAHDRVQSLEGRDFATPAEARIAAALLLKQRSKAAVQAAA